MLRSNRENREELPAFSQLFNGLGRFMETLNEMLEEDNKEKVIKGKINPGKKLQGSYGINIILDPINSPGFKARKNSFLPVCAKPKENNSFELHPQKERLLVVGVWGEYTPEETSIRVIGKKLLIRGEKNGEKTEECLELPGIGYAVAQIVHNNGIIQITLRSN